MSQQTINRNLYYLRNLAGMLQDEVAKRIKKSRASVIAYEQDRPVPAELLPVFAKVFETSVDTLLTVELMPPDVLKAYLANRAAKKEKQGVQGDTSPIDPVVRIDRGFIIEVLLRNNLRQKAKIRALLEKRDLKEVEAEINSDNVSIMKSVAEWMAQNGNDGYMPVFPSEP